VKIELFILRILFIASFFLSFFLAKSNNLPAFPGAEGFGKYTVGGRGGKVVAVTNLDDYKSTETAIEGSLRWALSQHVETFTVDKAGTPYTVTRYVPLTIVFKVSGIIWLKEDLKVKRDSLTIAGQTAPGDGICIAGRSVLFNGATGGEMFYWGPRRKDLIVRYIRFRAGVPKDASGVPTSSFVTYGCDVENYENVIFDHCTMSWANEECLAIYDNKNTTLQWCIVSEGLYNAYHSKGQRSYGGVWGGQFASFHHNLIAHNVSRTARFNGARAHDTLAVIDYRNNVIYNWGNSDGAAGGEIEITGGRSELNIINNYYKKGPAYSFSATPSITNKGHRILQCYDAANPTKGTGKHYVKGNYLFGYPTVTADNWKYGVQFKYYSVTDTATTFNLFRLNEPSSEVTNILPNSLSSAETSFTNVLNNAGSTFPLRDAHDKRIVLEVLNGTASGSGSFGNSKGIIDDPDVLGGWPIFATGAVPIDTDEDGMPDEWEITNSLDINNPNDRNTIATSGYTMLEEYLNSIGTFQNFLQAPFNLKVALNTSNKPQLTWQDVSDTEQGYEIQRSIGDENSFETFASVGVNTSSYVDESDLEQGLIYTYRVRTVSGDLVSVFSNQAKVTIPSSVKNNVISAVRLYPNPVIDELQIKCEEDISSIKVYNSVGILIEHFVQPKHKIDMRDYPKGVYYFYVSISQDKEGVFKVIKL
jgi:hypothetical protein